MIGDIIDGYFVISFLGQGTFANTYLVEKNDTKYAMKVFKNEMIRSERDEIRIKREIKSLQIVDHPNVIKYIDDGLFKLGYDTFRYLVMEYATGEPLRNMIQKINKLNVSQSLNIISQVLEGLNAVHDAGFLHRDLKPDNIFVQKSGRVQILDFGLVKFLDASTLTATGSTLGTYAYMSPEQLKDSSSIDARADIYSAGAILYHMLTGNYPIEIKSLMEAPFKIMTETPKIPSLITPSIPENLDGIIMNTLEKDVYWRKHSVNSLLEAFSNINDYNTESNNVELDVSYFARLMTNEKSLINSHIETCNLDGIVFQANFLPKYKAVYNDFKDFGGKTIIDPMVYKLAYSKFTSQPTVVNLPYVLNKNSKELSTDFDTIEKCKYRAVKVIDWQLENNANILLSAFHYLENVNDEWLNKDLIVFNESKKYVDSKKISKPLFVGVSIKMESIANEKYANILVTELTRIKADGYYLMMDVDLESKITSHYYWFIKLVNMLSSQGKPIAVSRVNSFSLLLTGFGVSILSSGIGFVESFREALLIEEAKGFNMKPKYYIPELMNNFNEEQLKDIMSTKLGKQYVCNCPYCNGSDDYKYLFSKSVSKGHYLYQKNKISKKLSSMSYDERISWFTSTTSEAINNLKIIKKESRSKKLNFDFMKTWLKALEEAQKDIRSVDEDTIHLSQMN